MQERTSNSQRECALKLLAYCRENDWAGYDPYDALNSILLKRLPILDHRLPRIALTQLMKRSPVNLRPLLKVPKAQNPKAIALFLMALLRLSRLGILPDGKELVTGMADRLAALRSTDANYWNWGYSFPWQTRTSLVARASPNLVCTCFVAQAFLDAYEWDHNPASLNVASSAADYVVSELYWTAGNGKAAFAYPVPSSRAPVHNANLLGAALLARVSKYRKDERYLDAALAVARYSAAKQRADGSWFYGEASTQRWVDNFHTGYNLCALRDIAVYANTSEFDGNLKLGFQFYREHFVTRDGRAGYFHDQAYPIDIHSVAQTIITLLRFSDFASDSAGLAGSVLEWARGHLWDERGYFYYQQHRLFKIRIPYMRWSEAWMLLALAFLLEHGKSAPCTYVDANHARADHE